MSKHPFPEVAHAVVDGKEIQYRPCNAFAQWTPLDRGHRSMGEFLTACSWIRNYEWRVKPEPVTVRSRRYWWQRLGEMTIGICNDEEWAGQVDRQPFFMGWLDADWQVHALPERFAK